MKHLITLLASTFILLGGCAAGTATDHHNKALTAAIESRSAEDRSRDGARHPAQTLAFFQIEPGMRVAEGLPGGGWYTRLLANYLGADGAIYGVNYADRMWPLFSWANEESTRKRIAATAEFGAKVAGFTDNGIQAQGFTFESVPEALVGTIDRVVLIRALHNLNRFEETDRTRSKALAAVRLMLKDDGLVGVVQHRAPENASYDSTRGQRGYLKQSDVIAMFAEAGFELVASSEINANPNDQPAETDVVWRLPPSLRGSEDDAEKRAAMLAIGESDRMTLLFKKTDASR